MSSNWIDRVNNMEANPPENGWGKIAAALDESLNGASFPAALYEAEVTPPARVWSGITNELDGTNVPEMAAPKAKVIPLILRYAAAACFIGLIAFGAFRFFGKSADSSVAITPDTTSSPLANETVKVNDTPVEEENTEPETQAQKDDEALEQSKETYAKLDLARKPAYSKLYKSPAQLTSFTPAANAKTPEIQYSHRAAVTDSPVEESDRYAMYRDEDGRFIRISKKLAELFCCVSGEVQDDKCNTQLKEWRQKIASSPFNPSPDNFMDILDLINSIQDNRN